MLSSKNIKYLIFFQALLATLGSLFFSEVLKYPPCVLCWYQRIVMYPVVVISAVSILRQERGLSAYVLPLSLIGLAISAYHNLLYYNLIPESVAPCVAGVSCTTKFFAWFGFITIPFLSMVGFIVISVLAWILLKQEQVKSK